MAGTIRTIYWDTSVFLAWFKNEDTHGLGVTAGMREHREQFNQQKLNIATSTVTLVEILNDTLDDRVKSLFVSMRGRTNFNLVNVDSRIAQRASDIRNHYKGANDGFPTVDTPDAIHLATATLRPNCGEFYTLDRHNREENAERNVRGKRGLLRLSGYFEEEYGLKISRPTSDDMQLFDSEVPDTSERI